MSTLTSGQREYLNHTFNVLHGQEGKTAQAARIAEKALYKIDKEESPEFWAELAQQAVVLSHAAALTETSFVSAMPHLLNASNLARGTYPMAATAEQAQAKATPWQTVYGGGEAGAFETFRTTVKLLGTLRGVLKEQASLWAQHHQQNLTELQSSLLNILVGQSAEDYQTHRASLLAGLEFQPYDQAAELLPQFLEEFSDPHAKITAYSRWFGRSWQAGNYRAMLASLRGVIGSALTEPALAKQAARDMGKVVFASNERRVAHWRQQISLNPGLNLAPLVEEWDNVTHASSGERTWPLR